MPCAAITQLSHHEGPGAFMRHAGQRLPWEAAASATSATIYKKRCSLYTLPTYKSYMQEEVSGGALPEVAPKQAKSFLVRATKT